jgi:hypothetical protein
VLRFSNDEVLGDIDRVVATILDGYPIEPWRISAASFGHPILPLLRNGAILPLAGEGFWGRITYNLTLSPRRCPFGSAK